jgi:hypothetical protein
MHAMQLKLVNVSHTLKLYIYENFNGMLLPTL